MLQKLFFALAASLFIVHESDALEQYIKVKCALAFDNEITEEEFVALVGQYISYEHKESGLKLEISLRNASIEGPHFYLQILTNNNETLFEEEFHPQWEEAITIRNTDPQSHDATLVLALYRCSAPSALFRTKDPFVQLATARKFPTLLTQPKQCKTPH